MPGDYAVLAPVYNQVGMGDFAAAVVPRLVEFAQRHDWAGRRILELGFGTGATAKWLGRIGPVVGVDESADMLRVAQEGIQESGLNVRLLQQDMRNLSGIDSQDLALALNVMNEFNSLSDLEAVFKSVRNVLGPNRLFIFDMQTVEGLAQASTNRERLVYDNPEQLTVFTRSEYDYERQMQTTDYTIFRTANGSWQRSQAKVVLRGFPVQAVAAQLQRSGYSVSHVLGASLEPYEVGVSRAPRVFFFARK
ncbi:MAG: class I SAM-dependent methyltransferase, partial [Anaerolineae bacterium]